ASLATPYHVWIVLPLVQHVTHTGTFFLLNELQPLQFRLPTDWCVLGLTLAAAFTLGTSRTVQIFPTLVLLAGAFVSFRAQRDIWFVVVVSLVIVAGALRSAPRERRRMTPRQLALVAVLTGALVIGGGVVKDLSPHALEAAVRREYPVAAAAVVEERRYPG